MSADVFQRFGFSREEAEMYGTLLPLGDVPIREIIRATGQHPQVVYRLIDRLAAKGLLTSTTRHHRRYVRAEDPNAFYRAQQLRLRELKEALPDLLAQVQGAKAAIVRTSRGSEAVRYFRSRAFDELPERGTYYVIGASGIRFYSVMGDFYRTVEERRIAKGIRKKMLAYESQRATLERNETMRAFVEIRYLPETFSVPASTNIFANTVGLFVWTADPIVITIESPEVADSYRDYFRALWRVARP